MGLPLVPCACVVLHQQCLWGILATFASCPIPEIARLGRTLRQWKDIYLGYFTTGGANNGGAEAINGIIELHRRIARGYRNPTN